mgnify:CR=1 FL=1
MDNSGTQFVATAGQLFETMEKRVDQRAAIPRTVSGTWHSMDRHSGRFVDDGEVLILVHDVEGDVLGKGFQRRQLNRSEDRDRFGPLEPQRGLRRFPIYLDLAILKQLLHACAADVIKARDQKLVEASAGIVGGNLESLRITIRHASIVQFPPRRCNLEEMALTDAQFHRIAKALADPRRFEILERLANSKELPCADLRCDLPITAATLSHHIKELHDAGLIDVRREGKFDHMQLKRQVWKDYVARLGKI